MPGAAHAGMIGQRLDLSFYFIPFITPNVNKQKKTLSRVFRNFLKFLFFGEGITHLKASEERVTAKAQLMTEQKALPSRNSTRQSF